VLYKIYFIFDLETKKYLHERSGMIIWDILYLLVFIYMENNKIPESRMGTGFTGI
jgi:hypothetical protein